MTPDELKTHYEACIEGYTEEGRALEELHNDLADLCNSLLRQAQRNNTSFLDIALDEANKLTGIGCTLAASAILAAAYYHHIQQENQQQA